MTVARTDLVTLGMKVPDNFADLVTLGTPVVVQVGDQVMEGKVSRFTAVIGERDRTLKVEADFFNGPRPRYHRLISEFARLTGVPVVLNTSFNENEPIVMTPEQAVDTFAKTKMDLLVLGNLLVRRPR